METLVRLEQQTLSQSELRIIELEKKKDEIKAFYEDYKAALEHLVEEHGVDHFFQDADGVVYKTTVPDGRFVAFDRFAVQRTRRDGETKGSLSMKEAREAGFVVEGK